MATSSHDAAAVARSRARVEAHLARPLIKALNDEDAKGREQLLSALGVLVVQGLHQRPCVIGIKARFTTLDGSGVVGSGFHCLL
jgi:hypothetical protein